MDIDQLRHFMRSADLRSFSKAASERFLTPQAVSRQVGALEDELGFKLFERSNKGIGLTDAGRVFYGYARRVCDLAEEGMQRGRQAAGLARPRLDVGSYRNANVHLLPKVAEAFRQVCPEVDLRFVDLRDFEDIDESLRSHRIRATLTVGNAGAAKEGVAYLNVGYEGPACWVSSAGPLAQRERLALEDLRGLRLVFAAEGYSLWQDRLCAYVAAHEPSIEILRSTGNESGVLLLEDERCVGVSMPSITPFSRKWRTMVPFDPPEGVPDRISVDLATNAPDDPLVQKLLQVCRHVYGRMPAGIPA